MIHYGKISKFKAWELELFQNHHWPDPFFECRWRRTGDHPGLFFTWMAFGWTIIELAIYDTRHEEEINK